MAFSQQTKEAAYRRAGGRCECTRTMCGHSGRCNADLRYGWDAHHRHAQAAGGGDDLGNCEALCTACHKNTHSYGRSQ
jgi:5-methylcytosine-specific restriction endonuclease McrA